MGGYMISALHAFCITVCIPLGSSFSTAPNVLMIAVDDLRPEISGAYGQKYMITPNLDRLMSWGTTFTRAYCQYSLCSPSRTSVLVGRRPDHTRVWNIGPYFRKTMVDGEKVITLPQWFKLHGYNVTGQGKIFHPGTSSGGPVHDEGGADMPYSWSEPYWFCDQFYNGTVQSTAAQGWPNGTGCVQSLACHQCLKAAGSEGNIKPSWKEAPCDASCYPDGLVALNAVKQLKQAAETPASPFFISVGFKRPHLGWFAPTSFFDLYPNGSLPLATHRVPPTNMPSFAFSGNPEIIGMKDVHDIVNRSSGFPLIPDWKHHELRRAYYATVSFMDSQLGLVLDALESTGLKNSTNVMFWGDHGYSLGEQGIWSKLTNFELGTRVPLILAVPGQENPGSMENTLVELLDVYPTLVDVAGLPHAPSVEGRSLLPLLSSQTKMQFSKKPSFSQFKRGPKNAMGCSMRTEKWRYTAWVSFNYTTGTPNWKSIVGRELYDHSGDLETDFNKYENENLAELSQYINITQQLHQQLIQSWDI